MKAMPHLSKAVGAVVHQVTLFSLDSGQSNNLPKSSVSGILLLNVK